MNRSDLDNAIGSAKVTQLSDDNADGVADSDVVNTMIAKAEQRVVSILLRAYSLDEIVVIMTKDQFARSNTADIACEYLSRRKGDFASEDGKGRYYQAFKEASDHFEKLSHGRVKTSATPTKNKQEGGRIRPPNDQDGDGPPFIFAPTESRRPRGGF